MTTQEKPTHNIIGQPSSTESKTQPILLPKTRGHLEAEQQLKDLRRKHLPDTNIVPRRP